MGNWGSSVVVVVVVVGSTAVWAMGGPPNLRQRLASALRAAWAAPSSGPLCFFGFAKMGCRSHLSVLLRRPKARGPAAPAPAAARGPQGVPHASDRTRIRTLHLVLVTWPCNT
jgi:hypothetical protein